MKNFISKIGIALLLGGTITSCSKFEDMNVDPLKANDTQAKIEYFFNNSLTGAQQDPNIAERIFVLDWKTAGRQHMTNGLALGTVNDDYSKEYYRYSAEWIKNASKGIEIANNEITAGTAKDYTNNIVQITRIWRAYLISEAADNFGPMPLDFATGENPKYKSVQDVYYFLFEELKDAISKINKDVKIPEDVVKFDRAFGFKYDNWLRYANSMRMRLAMRLSEVDAEKAQSEFEAAVATNLFITNTSQNFTIAEREGWDPLSGVMSREWNSQTLSATLNNLFIGLGGIESKTLVQPELVSSIKAQDYIGKRYANQFTTMTNDPSAGYWLDGLPNKIDPRAYKAFFIPGDFSNSNYSLYPTYTKDASTNVDTLVNGSTKIAVNTKYTWNAFSLGDWAVKGTNNRLRTTLVGKVPALGQQFRASTNSRIFFANWESYFLLAEAAIRGWATGTTAQAAYENGIKANFEYWGVSQYAGDYLNSSDYNRIGTSVNFAHTAEPTSGYIMNYVDGYTGSSGTTTINYPVNTIYKNGSVRNDALTKIITQKYIANLPWLPLESWNDHRRLGLPFFENPAIENALPNLPDLNSGNYKTNSIKFYPQRLPFPSSFRDADPTNYQEAVSLLGGEDKVLTPLWWAKKN
ncbi:SusD/RagB family nutrient-binding outer membrane lipoprotein [Sphingobacterium sp. SYP-B4668]|uniref:SusD/RagB family nutrient-binding outer membrane lipoprotein n=1 Tax=Sphingobacterium sp. SYP-B4668 TaxID=2996035 RepID=UPI0022DD981D|nr:SusD/RagB family nutrient-binding outer membrane lipoprotein [Sphingobacterium sp. SYP-B4668]